MGSNDLCRERCNSVGSQASLWGLSSWTDASLVALSFWEQCSKQRPPKENAKRPARLPKRNGGAKPHFSRPRKLPRKKLAGPWRGRHRKRFLPRSLQLVRVMETRNGSWALRLHHCLKTTLRFQNSPGMSRGRHPARMKGIKCLLPFSLSLGTDVCILFIICRPVVKQVQEKVFTSDAFQALDLHPHLVSIRPCFLGVSILGVCLFIQNVCEVTVLGRKNLKKGYICSRLPS